MHAPTQAHSTILGDETLEHWRTHGYAIVEGFLSSDEVDKALASTHKFLPTWEQFCTEPESWPIVADGFKQIDFPYPSGGVNSLAIHPDLITFSERALGTTDIVLSHSEILAKYAGAQDFDQPMHMDWPTNSLVVPPKDDIDTVASIIYLTGATVETGPTRVLPFGEAEQWTDQPFLLRDTTPEAYDRELSVVVPPGSILLYGLRTFHRGSAMTASEGARFTLHTAYQRADLRWAGWRSLSRALIDRPLYAVLTHASPRQREVLGFPAVGDPYWTLTTIAAVQARYPKMDMRPYEAAL